MDTKQIGVICLIAILAIGAIAFGLNYSSEKALRENTMKQLQEAQADLGVAAEANSELLAENELLAGQVDELGASVASAEETLTQQQEQINALEDELIEQEVSAESGYLYVEDELMLGSTFNIGLSDKDINLLDGEIEFDDEDYDVEEYFYANGLVAINEKDFEDNAYLIVEEENIKYEIIFDNSLDISKISDDEPLEIMFLGEPYKITEWNGDEITLSYGISQFLGEEVVEFEDHIVTIVNIYDDEVIVDVDGTTELIEEGDTEEFGDIEIYVENVMNDDTNPMVKIVIANTIEETIEAGDEYSEDSIWNWIVDETNFKLGLELNVDFDEIDEDEDYQALMPGAYISLPNNYVTMVYTGLSVEDYEGYDFEVDDGMLEVKGNFEAGMDAFDKIYVNATGIYDEDMNLLTDVIMAESELEVSVKSGNWFKINIPGYDNVVIALDLSDVKVGGTGGISLVDVEDNYRTDFGIIISEPEDSIEDEELSISVPEEAITASISFN